MRKTLVVILAVLITPIVSGFYGIIHDQITYTISPEYYTHFKFAQFGIADEMRDRLGVALVGWMATWWTGLLIGLVFGLVGLIHSDTRTMSVLLAKSVIQALAITFVMGLIGLALGKFIFSEHSFRLPEGVTDRSNFIAVGWMHNFGYLGGLISLVAGIVLHIRKYVANKKMLSGNKVSN